jgi:hypothetical protein
MPTGPRGAEQHTARCSVQQQGHWPLQPATVRNGISVMRASGLQGGIYDGPAACPSLPAGAATPSIHLLSRLTTIDA